MKAQTPVLIAIFSLTFLVGCGSTDRTTFMQTSTTTVMPSHTNTPSSIATLELANTPIPAQTYFSEGWTTYTNGNEEIRDLAFDNNGSLWVASRGGLVRWNIADRTYKKYTTADGLPTNQIDSVFFAQDGTLWVSASNVLSRWSSSVIMSFCDGEWIIHQKPEQQGYVEEIFQDTYGKLWFVGNNVTTYNGKTWQTYTMEDGLGSSLASSISEDIHGNIWLGTWFPFHYNDHNFIEGVSRFNGRKWDILGSEIGLDDNDPISGIHVNTIAADHTGGMWFGTVGFGALYYDGEKSQTFTTADGLSDDTINDIQLANDGTVWFATGNGVTAYDGDDWRIFSSDDGVIHNEVLSIAIASDHSLWFGTKHGLSQFDGQAWHSYTTTDMLPTTYVRDIDSTEQGAVWLATGRGSAFTDGKDWQMITKESGLPSDDVKLVAIAPDETLWFGTSQGLIHIDGQAQQIYPAEFFDYEMEYELHAMAIDDTGGLWMGLYGIYHFDGRKWTPYLLPSLVIRSEKLVYSPTSGVWTGGWCTFSNFDGNSWVSYRGFVGNDIRALTVAPNGKVWVATNLSEATFHTETGFTSFDGQNWKLEATLDLRDVTDMDFSPDGTLWVATREGAYKYDGGNWTHYTMQDGLAGNVITRIHVAGDDAVWFCTDEGLTRFEPPIHISSSPLTPLPPVLPSTPSVTPTPTILPTPAAIHASTYRPPAPAIMKTHQLSDGCGTTYIPQDWQEKIAQKRAPTFNTITATTDGILWFANVGGLISIGDGIYQFDGKTWMHFTSESGLPSDEISAIAVASDGAVWMGTFCCGVSRFDGKTWTVYTTEQGLSSNDVRSILVAPDGAVWFGTSDQGVSRFDGITWQTYTQQNGLWGNYVGRIFVLPDQSLLFSSSNGTSAKLTRFDGDRWTNYPTPWCDQGKYTSDMAAAPNGDLWFGTEYTGVYRLSGNTWTRYTVKDGLVSDAISGIAIAVDGSIWFGTQNGISRFDETTWTTFTLGDDSTANWITAIFAAPDGAIWVGYNGGMTRYTLSGDP